ncbi:hypothetical protein E0G74_01265 [Salmonella enterica]|nr:hypothetical protein [Salmonella enterica]EGD6457169.1 hypothetical protein [Salmonella enterica]
MPSTTSKRQRRIERTITAYVNRMDSNMTCLVAMWPDLAPKHASDLQLSWRRLKKHIKAAIDQRLWELKRDAVTHSYIQALNMAATEQDRANIHNLALMMYPDFRWLLVDLHINFCDGITA